MGIQYGDDAWTVLARPRRGVHGTDSDRARWGLYIYMVNKATPVALCMHAAIAAVLCENSVFETQVVTWKKSTTCLTSSKDWQNGGPYKFGSGLIQRLPRIEAPRAAAYLANVVVVDVKIYNLLLHGEFTTHRSSTI